MDEITHNRNANIFNTPLESGLRALIVLTILKTQALDLQQLVFFDYLVTHSGDIEGGPESLHADIPQRISAIALRRKLTTAGLDLMVSRDLVLKQFDPINGVTFKASELAQNFLKYFETPYAKSLIDRAHWVVSRFAQMDHNELKAYFSSNFDRWNSEFSKEAFERSSLK